MFYHNFPSYCKYAKNPEKCQYQKSYFYLFYFDQYIGIIRNMEGNKTCQKTFYHQNSGKNRKNFNCIAGGHLAG